MRNGKGPGESFPTPSAEAMPEPSVNWRSVVPGYPERSSLVSAAEGDRLLYRPEEVAGLLGIGRSAVFELISTGEITSFKIGNRRLIPREALRAFVDRKISEATLGATG